MAVADDEVEPTQAADVWTRLRLRIASAVRRQCPDWLRADADDLAQAAVMKVMAQSAADEAPRPMSSYYLHRVAHSALVDEIRRRQRRREVALEVSGGDQRVYAVEPRATGTPEQTAALRELGAAVRSCLLAMKAERRMAVTLHLQGHTVPESARLLGWDVKRTDNLVYRGLADLRQCLVSRGHTP